MPRVPAKGQVSRRSLLVFPPAFPRRLRKRAIAPKDETHTLQQEKTCHCFHD